MYETVWNATASALWVLWTTMLEYPATTNVIVVALIIGMMLFFSRRHSAKRLRKFRRERGRKMTRKERQQYIRDLIGDKITDVIEELEFAGRISRPEARTLYRRLSQVLHIKALLPRKGDDITDDIRKQLENIQKVVFGKKPPNIPGPKPGEDLKVIPFPDYTKQGAAQPTKKFGQKYLSKKSA